MNKRERQGYGRGGGGRGETVCRGGVILETNQWLMHSWGLGCIGGLFLAGCRLVGRRPEECTAAAYGERRGSGLQLPHRGTKWQLFESEEKGVGSGMQGENWGERERGKKNPNITLVRPTSTRCLLLALRASPSLFFHVPSSLLRISYPPDVMLVPPPSPSASECCAPGVRLTLASARWNT